MRSMIYSIPAIVTALSPFATAAAQSKVRIEADCVSTIGVPSPRPDLVRVTIFEKQLRLAHRGTTSVASLASCDPLKPYLVEGVIPSTLGGHALSHLRRYCRRTGPNSIALYELNLTHFQNDPGRPSPSILVTDFSKPQGVLQGDGYKRSEYLTGMSCALGHK